MSRFRLLCSLNIKISKTCVNLKNKKRSSRKNIDFYS